MSDAASKGATRTPGGGDKRDQKKATDPSASVRDTLSFAFGAGTGTKFLFTVGSIAGIGNGLVYPMLAYLFSNSFNKISGAASNGLGPVRQIAFTFMAVGSYALVMATIQSACFEIVAYRASQNFRLQWFRALLRQDTAFYDVYDIGGLASTIGSNSNKYRRGMGRKFGEGIQFLTTAIGGIGYAFYASWQTALVVICVLPLASIAAMSMVTLNQTQGSRAAAAYKDAGGVAYSTVSAIKTVLSLNAIPKMIDLYSNATAQAFKDSTSVLWKQGLAFGSTMSSFMLLYCVLTLFGTFLIARDIDNSGCDPSGGVKGNATCSHSGVDLFGAMLGLLFAAQGVSQVGNFFETFTVARVAAYPALQAINRKPGAPDEIIYKTDNDEATSEESETTSTKTGEDVEAGHGRQIKAILPKYTIDSSSDKGVKPEKIRGALEFKNVEFSYPTRPNTVILKDFSLEIPAGKTVALVGPSGGGKSTTVALIERFYDPLRGNVELDGVDLKEINVKHLRHSIGYVGQEPTLFATTIAGNIKYGNPNATQEQIEAAARKANAHDFIMSFPDGYNTQVGDKGAQLSGGQKQRIAIARVLVGNPSILLLDEATSALDSESELVVQEALDNVVAEHKRTTIIIAHRLSTIRNADLIAVISDGRVVEIGTHDDLMASDAGHYRNLVQKQDRGSSSMNSSRESSSSDLTQLDVDEATEGTASNGVASSTPHFEFKDIKFAYPTRPQKPVFRGMNLTISQGETVALVGPSGGGKSTTVALIERFYDPTEGTVEYLGHDIKSLNIKWYRDQIGYVGQEPTLFNDTIGNNIAYGAPNATMEQIIDAAKQANAHDFIMSFPDGYNTPVGERGAQLSGGQKQRVAIARALVKKPKVLLLDEATSALDTESEAIVQDALDKIMLSRVHTTIVIAHRLSTIRNADRIAFIGDGVVKEFGTHDELLSKPRGRYKRLVDAQKRGTTLDSIAKRTSIVKHAGGDDDDEEYDWKAEVEEEEKMAFSMARARQLAAPDLGFMAIGSVGAILAGGIFPLWGILFSETVGILFLRVYACDGNASPVREYTSCAEYRGATTHYLRHRSYIISIFWIVIGLESIVGFILSYWGFGMASERLNKRMRDSAFSALVRQEVSFFDKRSVGSITSQLQDDAARIHTFSGEPIRSLLIALSSVLTGVVLSFAYMWPFALLALACIPVMGFATSIEMKQFVGEDAGTGQDQDELNSPGGIVVETLLNIRTVSALTLEQQRYDDYFHALVHGEPSYVKSAFASGMTSGLSMFIQQWINALQMWWGGYILFHHPNEFEFKDFLIAQFALLFALFGLGAAFQGLSDKTETEKSAGRIFYLLDRKSEIDPLGEEGKRLD